MKNKLVRGLLAGVVMLSGLTLFACGGNDGSNPNDVYTKTNNIIEKMREDSTSAFTTTYSYEIFSSYVFSAFKNSEDSMYNGLFVLPMNYISSHYKTLENIKNEKNISNEGINAINNLSAKLDSLEASYKSMQEEYKRLKIFDSSTGVHEGIYNGALQNFRYEATSIIGSAYSVAIEIANVEETVFKVYSGMKDKEITTNDSLKIKDYLSLFVGYDYYNLLLNNCHSVDLTTKVGFVGQVETKFASFMREFAKFKADGLKNLVEQYQEEVGEGEDKEIIVTYDNKAIDKLLSANRILSEERKNLETALSKYSFYDNYFNSEDINESSDQFTQVHVDEIEAYYNLYLVEHTKFIKSILVK